MQRQILINANIFIAYVLNLPLNTQRPQYHSQRAGKWNLILAHDSRPIYRAPTYIAVPLLGPHQPRYIESTLYNFRIPFTELTPKPVFHQIWIMMEKSFTKWASGLSVLTHVIMLKAAHAVCSFIQYSLKSLVCFQTITSLHLLFSDPVFQGYILWTSPLPQMCWCTYLHCVHSPRVPLCKSW